MKKIRIACLPVAGKENPYQSLMIKGLNNDEQLHAFNGINDKFLGIIRTAIINRPAYIHFDWETSYYWRRKILLTWLSIPLFMIQVLAVRYLMRIKLIWTPHNITPHDLSHTRLHRMVRSFFASQMLYIRLFSHVSIERASREFKVSKTKFVVVAEGSYLTSYPNDVNKEDSIQKLGLSKDKIKLVYLGYIKPYKGLDQLIEFFYTVLNDDYELIIAGKVMDKLFFSHLKTKIKDRIKIYDRFILDEEVQYFYNVADVVVLPFNKVENSGSAILAMGFGKPIIAPAIGVLPERLAQQSELLYSENIEEGLLKLKRYTLAHLKALGERNKKAVLKYKWEDFSKVFLNEKS